MQFHSEDTHRKFEGRADISQVAVDLDQEADEGGLDKSL
jgi:hypothetical protein